MAATGNTFREEIVHLAASDTDGFVLLGDLLIAHIDSVVGAPRG